MAYSGVSKNPGVKDKDITISVLERQVARLVERCDKLCARNAKLVLLLDISSTKSAILEWLLQSAEDEIIDLETTCALYRAAWQRADLNAILRVGEEETTAKDETKLRMALGCV